MFIIGVLTLLCLGANQAFAIIRFPHPEFESGYAIPDTFTPAPRAAFLEYVDIAVLIICLSLASYLGLRKRTRTGIFFLMLFSLLYFGFWRKGCVCPVGATQNIALVLFDSLYRIPIAVVVFFTIPLLFALFFGRTFCAAVCPLGALQDVFLLKPVKLPSWLSQTLGMIPYLYLGFIILGVATGSGFFICRYYPFVSFFRRSGSLNRLIYSTAFLLAGVFIGRPYCRFLCPYSVLLRWMSRFSKWHVTITPDECVQCRLCEDACPFGLIHAPLEVKSTSIAKRDMRRLLVLLILVPVLIASGGVVGSRLNVPLSQINRRVLLAEQVARENAGTTTETTLETQTFRQSGEPESELFSDSFALRGDFRRAGFFIGCFLGFVLSMRLIELSVKKKRDQYEIDGAGCFSCGRCFSACPKEQSIRKSQKGRIIVHEP
jgi:NosR/NirI family nitrous oxide reductase transcriptional regulator